MTRIIVEAWKIKHRNCSTRRGNLTIKPIVIARKISFMSREDGDSRRMRRRGRTMNDWWRTGTKQHNLTFHSPFHKTQIESSEERCERWATREEKEILEEMKMTGIERCVLICQVTTIRYPKGGGGGTAYRSHRKAWYWLNFETLVSSLRHEKLGNEGGEKRR